MIDVITSDHALVLAQRHRYCLPHPIRCAAPCARGTESPDSLQEKMCATLSGTLSMKRKAQALPA